MKSCIEIISHLGNTRCTNILLTKAIGVTYEGAQEMKPNPTWEQAVSHVLYFLASCVHDLMLSYIRKAKTPNEAWENLKIV